MGSDDLPGFIDDDGDFHSILLSGQSSAVEGEFAGCASILDRHDVLDCLVVGGSDIPYSLRGGYEVPALG
jgi:hypothetical protein